MRRPAFRSAAAALLSAALALGAAGGPDPDDRSSEDLVASVEQITAPLEELRGLKFTTPLATGAIGRSEARAYLNRLLRDDYPPERLAAEQAAYRYFGLLGPEQELEPLLMDLLESQVAGFYDPGVKKLFVLPGPMGGTLALAHEMAHALADQHFDLEALEARARSDDDRMLALAALIEGEATMVTYLWAFRSALDPGMPALVEGDPAELMEAAAAGMEGVPPFLSASLTFPYTTGGVWASEIMKKGGGLKALDPYFLHPPDSTEQILHPERSMEPRDRPSRIDPSVTEAALAGGEPVIKSDTMGEFGIRFLLAGEEAAAGWDADRYQLAGSGAAVHLAWVSVWDSEDEAREFESAIRSWLEDREGPWAVRRSGAVVALAEGKAGGGRDPEARVRAMLSRIHEGIEIR